MSLGVKYRGSFVGQDGTVWRADILLEGYSGSVGELTFPWQRPLEIEWKETGKEEVLCGSIATLKIESPGDRTYVDLYTRKVCSVALEVYRSGSLWWAGTLDPEFYEEPYERQKKYDVTLTFEDFGVLGRLSYRGSGIVSLSTLLRDALGRCSLGGLPLELLSSTQASSVVGSALTESSGLLENIGVLSANFYDEDGEALTLGEAIEGSLQPLGLRMIQRGGRIYVYDLNALYHGGAVRTVAWSGSKQTLGVDRAANNIKITWSPYGDASALGSEGCWVLGSDASLVNLGANMASTGDISYLSWHSDPDVDNWDDETDVGFTLLLSGTGKGAQLGTSGSVLPMFYKLMPHLQGADKEGVALVVTGIEVEHAGSRTYVRQATYGDKDSLFGYDTPSTTLVTFGPIDIPPVADPSSASLHLSLELLMDHKYNPYSTATNLKYSGPKDKDNSTPWKERNNFVNMPVRLKFTDAYGGEWYWSNSPLGVDYDDSTVSPTRDMDGTLGGWYVSSAISYLEWYDPQDLVNGSGLGTFTENRQAVNNSPKSLPVGLTRVTGQYVAMPPTAVAGGRLEIEVLDQWRVQRCRADGTTQHSDQADKTTFVLLGMPKVEVVKRDWLDHALSWDDVTYSSVADADAQDDVEIETICGTSVAGAITARGTYFVRHGSLWSPAQQFQRCGRTSTCEQLLIGTLYSQWATRHTKLEGEMADVGEGLCLYAEPSQDASARFMKTGEVVHAIEGVTDATLVELSGDEYDER